MMLDRKNVLVVVPAFNEEVTVGPVVRGIISEGFSTLVVSDGSTDKTIERARSAGALVLSLPVNLGVGGALRAGFRYACINGFAAAVQVDADGQHPTYAIMRLVDAANTNNSHLVIGSRFRSTDSTMSVAVPRRLAMRALAMTASIAARTRLTDVTSGFRLIKSPLLEEFAKIFPSNYLGDTYEATVAAARAGYVIEEIPAPLMPRQAGQSTATTIQGSLFTLKAIAVALTGLHPILPKTERKGQKQDR